MTPNPEKSSNNPYTPPDAPQLNQAELLKNLRSDTLAHRQLLFWYGLVYLSVGASYLSNSDRFSYSVIVVGALLLLTASWRYLISGISPWYRAGLVLMAILPVFGLLPMLLNHWWLSERASSLQVSSALFGPGLDSLNKPPR